MAQETITDYEVKTEEKTRTITICDNCGASDEEKTIVPVGINPKVEVREHSKREIFQVYDDKTEAERDLHRQLPSTPKEVPTQWGVGMEHDTDIKNAYVTAQSDLCVGCIDKILDVDVPEDEEITDIEFEDGGISIETEKVIEKNYPTISLPEIRTPGFGVGIVILFPLVFLISTLDLTTENVSEEMWEAESRATYSFYTGLGAILWSTIGVILYLGVGIVL